MVKVFARITLALKSTILVSFREKKSGSPEVKILFFDIIIRATFFFTEDKSDNNFH